MPFPNPFRNPLAYPGGVTPAFNPSHPASVDCRVSVIASGGLGVNLLNGKRRSATGGTPTNGILGNIGPVIIADSIDDRVDYVSSATNTFGFTAGAILQLSSHNTSGPGGIITMDNVNGHGQFAFQITTGFLFFKSSTAAVSALAPNIDTPYFVGMTFLNSVGTPYFVMTNLLTGQIFTQTVTGAGTNLLNNSTTARIVQGNNSATGGLMGGLACVMMSNAYLTPTQLLQWAQSPWEFWYPSRFPNRVGSSSGPQTLLPSLFTNTQTFGAASIARGSVDLTPSLVTNTQTFYAATVANSAPLTPSLFTNTQTFYAPTVAPGAVNLTPSLVTNSQTFYAPTVGRGTITLTPSLATNTQTFYGPTVTKANTILPGLFTNSSTFYAATVTGGTPSVAGTNNIVTTRRRRRR